MPRSGAELGLAHARDRERPADELDGLGHRDVDRARHLAGRGVSPDPGDLERLVEEDLQAGAGGVDLDGRPDGLAREAAGGGPAVEHGQGGLAEVDLHVTDEAHPGHVRGLREEGLERGDVGQAIRLVRGPRCDDVLGREGGEDVGREEPAHGGVADDGAEGVADGGSAARHGDGARGPGVTHELEHAVAGVVVGALHTGAEEGRQVEAVGRPRRVHDELLVALARDVRLHPVLDEGVAVDVGLVGLGRGDDPHRDLGGLGAHADLDEEVLAEDDPHHADVVGTHPRAREGDAVAARVHVEEGRVALVADEPMHAGAVVGGPELGEHLAEALAGVAQRHAEQALREELLPVGRREEHLDQPGVGERPGVRDDGGAVHQRHERQVRADLPGLELEQVVEGERERVRPTDAEGIGTRRLLRLHLDCVSLPLGMTGMVSGSRMKSKII